MFRYTTEIKGIVIDVDSFTDDIEAWKDLSDNYLCLFLTSDPHKEQIIKDLYGECTHLLDTYEKYLVPNQQTHIKVLDKLKVNFTEIVYVTADFEFIIRGLGFVCGMIWISDTMMTYRQAYTCPDLICSSIEDLTQYLKVTSGEYYGEAAFVPTCKSGKSKMIVTDLKTEDYQFNVFSLGRYYGNKHYMHALHPFSSAILQNKNPKNSAAYKAVNSAFEQRLLAVVKLICKHEEVNCICSVPARIGQENRFSSMLEKIANDVSIENVEQFFVNIRPYPSQKGLTAEERKRNIKDAFEYKGDLNGKSVILIDDILSTGSTTLECAEVLKRHGAKDVYIVVFGINQQEIPYWSNSLPVIICAKCKSKMKLFIKRTLNPFYACAECEDQKIDFESAKAQIIKHVNEEIYAPEIEFWEDLY